MISPNQMVSAQVQGAKIEDGAVLTFSHPPRPWRDGDLIELDKNQGKLIAEPGEGSLVFAWERRPFVTIHIRLEPIDPFHFRVRLRPSDIDFVKATNR
jgi:hypothetical protein